MPRASTKLIVDHRETIDEVARRNPRACTTSVVASVIDDDNGMRVVYATTLLHTLHAHIAESTDILPAKKILFNSCNKVKNVIYVFCAYKMMVTHLLECCHIKRPVM